MMTVNEMKAQQNRLQAMIEMIEESMTQDAMLTLKEAVANLLDECGSGYRSSDYYAPERYYIHGVQGVKNIRISDGVVKVKIVSPAGKLVPDIVTVRGETYPVKILYSNKYEEGIDY